MINKIIKMYEEMTDNILTILGGNEPRILTDKTLVSKNVYIPTLDA